MRQLEIKNRGRNTAPLFSAFDVDVVEETADIDQRSADGDVVRRHLAHQKEVVRFLEGTAFPDLLIQESDIFFIKEGSQMSAEDDVRVVHQPQGVDHPGKVRQKCFPASGLFLAAIPDRLKERFGRVLSQQGAHGAERFHASPFAAVAERASRIDLDMFKGRAVAVFSGKNVPVEDHRPAQVLADGDVDRVGELR